MDTEDKYLDAVLRWDTTLDEQPGSDVPIDGVVEFRYPRYQDDQPDVFDPDTDGLFWRHSFPFRSVEKDDTPWFGRPDDEKWSKRPIWKWQNPDQPVEQATLNPSIGLRSEERGIYFHCYIRDGEIDWL